MNKLTPFRTSLIASQLLQSLHEIESLHEIKSLHEIESLYKISTLTWSQWALHVNNISDWLQIKTFLFATYQNEANWGILLPGKHVFFWVLRAVYMGGGTRHLSFKWDFLWGLNGMLSKRMKWKTQTQLLTNIVYGTL